MPNWCEGTLKVRGKFEDVKRWAKENITVYNGKFTKKPDGTPEFEYVPVPDMVVFDDTCSDEFEMPETKHLIFRTKSSAKLPRTTVQNIRF